MRAEHFHTAALLVRMPRGQDGFWQIICRLSESQGTFSAMDIDGESNVSIKGIEKYIRLLVAGGFIAPLEVRKKAARGKASRFVAPLYRQIKFQKRTPRIRPDGSLIPATAIEQLWTAIRSLKTFGLKELIFAATTDEVTPSYALAKRYVHYLTTAGYLTAAVQARGRSRAWRLKPGMNTGPLPPCLKAVRARTMWDPNINTFVGGAPEASEVSP